MTETAVAPELVQMTENTFEGRDDVMTLEMAFNKKVPPLVVFSHSMPGGDGDGDGEFQEGSITLTDRGRELAPAALLIVLTHLVDAVSQMMEGLGNV